MALTWYSVRWLRTLVLSLTAASLAVSQGAREQCDIPPLALTWSNITVTQDGLGVTRGIELGVGSPHQIFAFRASTTLNNTRINNVLNCGSASNNSCIGSLGGGFDTSKSSTYAVSIKSQWNGSAVDQESPDGSYVYFNDDTGFQKQGDVDGFPLVMESEPFGGTQSGLPLGTNSSFLRAAVAGGVAPSQVYGLWPGSRGINPQDGLLVVGGYDSARINSSASFTSFPVGQWSLKRACPLQVSIRNLTFANLPLMNPGDAEIPACIEPSTQRFVFSPAVALNFAQYTGQNSTLFPKTMRYEASKRPAGDLQITLSNGYQTTIPNEELFAPLRGSDKNGRYTIINDTVVEAFVADNREANPAAVESALGGMFLTFNYLMVDYAKGEFNLAPAITTQSSTIQSNLTTICTPAAQNTPSATTSSASVEASKGSVSKGAIAGGVVGGVGGLAIIAGLGFLLFRRRKKAQNVNAAPPASDEPTPVQRHVSEMSAYETPQMVYEMPSQRHASVRKDAAEIQTRGQSMY